MKTIRRISGALMLITSFMIVLSSCEKDKRVPPAINLKTGTGYVSSDTTVSKDQALTVGVTADKQEDDMLTYNVSYAYDGTTSTTTYQTFNLTGSEQQHYEKDVTFTTRDQSGVEKWIFTITDKDGNIAQKQITLTVQ